MNQVYAYTSRRARTVPQLLATEWLRKGTHEKIHSNVRTGKEECGEEATWHGRPTVKS